MSKILVERIFNKIKYLWAFYSLTHSNILGVPMLNLDILVITLSHLVAHSMEKDLWLGVGYHAVLVIVRIWFVC